MTYEERTTQAMKMTLEELIFSYHWASDTSGSRLKTIERLAARCDELEQRPVNKETWAFCPECGSTDTENESGTYKQCAECGQDWYIDINYSVVIKEKLQMGRSLEAELQSHKSAINGMQDELDKVKRSVSVPDICWDYDNQEDGVYPDEMAVRLSDNLQTGESETFAVSCAKILTNRAISVSVSHEGEVTWEWEWDKLPEKDDEF